MSGETPLESIRLLADRFVRWQTPYGRQDPRSCPFVTPVERVSTHFHSPTFLALGLYAAHAATREPAYKDAADRYVVFYLAALRDTVGGGQRGEYAVWPYQYGMALAGYRAFRDRNPEEGLLDSKAAALYEWLLTYRWDRGSFFRNGYGVQAKGIEDCANSDDNCHMGRGLVAYHAASARPDVLADAEGLARYYTTECVPGTYDGCWSTTLGTWVVAPTSADSFEHFEGTRSSEMGWGFSSVGAIEYLAELAGVTADADLRDRIARVCASSMKWQFDACQFDDGACGMKGRDDRWIGMTAGAILSFLRVRGAGLLSAEEGAAYRPRAQAARRWLLANLTPDTVDAGGYFRVTGASEPRPPENQAWQLGWTLEALARLPELDAP